jgi:hypothetical protein
MFEVVIGGWGNKQSVSLHKVSPSHSLSLALFWCRRIQEVRANAPNG